MRWQPRQFYGAGGALKVGEITTISGTVDVVSGVRAANTCKRRVSRSFLYQFPLLFSGSLTFPLSLMFSDLEWPLIMRRNVSFDSVRFCPCIYCTYNFSCRAQNRAHLWGAVIGAVCEPIALQSFLRLSISPDISPSLTDERLAQMKRACTLYSVPVPLIQQRFTWVIVQSQSLTIFESAWSLFSSSFSRQCFRYHLRNVIKFWHRAAIKRSRF